MQVITTHLSADFDAFSAAVVAVRLFPGARVLFPGSQEAAVRRFLEQTALPFPELRLREARRDAWSRAIVVDTRTPRRLGEAWDCIQRSGCPVTLIDHHVRDEDGLGADEIVSRAVGATCTLIGSMLAERGLEPTSEEASLLLMGIYEDTGGLSYRETTPEDLTMAAWLVECGGSLAWVRRWVLKALQPEQLELLNELVEATEEVLVGSVPVSIAMVEVDRYYEEAAYVVHRWMETFEIPVGVVMLVRPPHINVIMRCRLEELDVGRVAQVIGGGGHPTAASAHVVDRMPVELREELLGALEREMPPPIRALDVASRQIFTVIAGDTVSAAKERLNKLRVNALPVQEGDELVGVLTRQTLDRAIGHGLAERPVSSVMQPSVPTVDEATSVEELGDLFLERSYRFVVVTRAGRPEGLVTRMDLLRRLFARQYAVGSSLDNRMAGAHAVRQSIGRMLRELTPDWVRALLEQVRQVADTQGVPVYLVGGIVRDLLLARPNEDLDLVVEGDGVALAHALGEAAGGRCHSHTPFMTAVVTLADGHRVDVASARTEFYRTPAAMPEVVTSLIRQDLYRRDFTINALAVALFGDRHGDLVDFFGGRKDLRRREIRVLHSLSFIDDPTRAIRAVRYARRLGFDIAADTRHLVRTAVAENVFARLSGQRLRRELQHLLAEAHPAQSLALVAELGLMPVVLPDLEWSEGVHTYLVEVENQLAWFELQELGEPPPPWLLYLGGLAVRAGGVAAQRLADRLQLAGSLRERLARLPANVAEASEAASLDLLRSDRARAVEDHDIETVLLAMAGLELERRRVLADALEAAVRVVVPVRGRQLLAAGIEPGPHIGQALRKTRDALVDGAIGSHEALHHAVETAAELAQIRPVYPVNPT